MAKQKGPYCKVEGCMHLTDNEFCEHHEVIEHIEGLIRLNDKMNFRFAVGAIRKDLHEENFEDSDIEAYVHNLVKEIFG